MDVDLIALILIGVAILVGLGTIAATVMLLVRDQPEPADDDLADKEPAADDEPFEELWTHRKTGTDFGVAAARRRIRPCVRRTCALSPKSAWPLSGASFRPHPGPFMPSLNSSR